ncbi:hypothetical protein N7457_005520 [Penicillium paradoxum]|uniref:uncharacterized protein n=1 Tax=Penicillium paradoxum TaxID=176176 RepID=UPI0025484703|nr:uncharacterized protein N7457_005520 [Penicillium paradoxum]KAJ5780360.1 hypothetical protein N7457_005520 [Penicillium paradoxum]
MLLKSTLFLLSAASALAQESCLSSSDPAACCASGAIEGEETVGETVFQYICGSIPSPPRFKGHKAANAYECAELCAQDDTCFATSWRISGSSPRGNCFFAIGEDFEAKEDKLFMLLAKAPEPVPDPPCLASPEANACCTGGRTEGEETVGDVRFRFTCGFVPTPSKFKGHSVGSAYECAELCAQDDTCYATSWRITGSNARGNCFFAMSQTFDSQANKDQMLISKIVDDDESNECDKEKEECLEEQKNCEADKAQCLADKGRCEDEREVYEADKAQCLEDKGRCEDEREVYEAVSLQCEADKNRAENAERECIRNSNELTEKKRQCREEQRQCHEEKSQQAIQCHEDKAQLNLEKQQCENQNNQLSLDIIKHQDEISELQSTITTLQSTIDNLNSTYLALHKECKGGSSCRSGIVNAEKRDDGCILPAGGKNFKIYYAKLDDPGAWDLGTPKVANFAACGDMCARTARCVRFAWATSNTEGTCWMRSHGQDRKPTKLSSWTSGQLV